MDWNGLDMVDHGWITHRLFIFINDYLSGVKAHMESFWARAQTYFESLFMEMMPRGEPPIGIYVCNYLQPSRNLF